MIFSLRRNYEFNFYRIVSEIVKIQLSVELLHIKILRMQPKR